MLVLKLKLFYNNSDGVVLKLKQLQRSCAARAARASRAARSPEGRGIQSLKFPAKNSFKIGFKLVLN
jgi:hypothetical protein